MADDRENPRQRRTEGDGDNGERRPQGPGGPNNPVPRPARGMFGFLALLTLGLMMLMVMANVGGGRGHEVQWREFANDWKNDLIDKDSVRITADTIKAVKVGGPNADRTAVYFRFNPGQAEYYTKKVHELTGDKVANEPTSVWYQVLIITAPIFLFIFVLWMLLSRGLRNAAGGPGGVLGSFGKSRHKVLMKEKTGITFADVAGIEEAKDEVDEVVQFLKAPKKFMRLGGRIPRGVLLSGDPGCGKTLLAKAIAGEADVPFFSISGSDFVEMFVGVGASRVRDLFKQAKEAAPCIIFLDEIDAVGRRRGGGFSGGGGHDEREQTLNAILVEMDGFTPSDGVIVIAATNRPDVLDPALIRPGRFDRQINVPLPDVKGRMEILRVHARKIKLGPDVNLERLAKATPMFSGADLAAIINEAAITATLQNKDFVEQEDLEESRDKIKFGRAKKSRVREADENKLTAYHEAGHAVLQVLLKDADPLHKVPIIPRGATGGATFSLPEKDRMGYGLKWLTATMRVCCGGRIAEMRAMGDVSSGASMDISQVTRIAHTMIEEWGMSPRLGFIRYAGSDTREFFQADKGYSDETAKIIDEEVKRLADEAYRDAEQILADNWDRVVAVAEALLKHETLNADEVHKLMRGESLGKPTISELLAAEARKTAAATPALARDTEPGLPPGTMPSPA